ncbi:MAG: acylphosphatase [Candidatus Methanoperedens sp.]|nr:acylphosphatase [Candidatus Methanoperedens sp.]
MHKCHNVMITGKVQDISFRALIEDIARLYDINGYSFNDTDGSVKMVCCGENGTVSEFLDEIKIRGSQKGAVIDNIAIEEIPFHIYLPQKFLRLYTDELSDIGRKLDRGNEYLKEILINSSELPDIKYGIETLNSKFDTFNSRFDTFNSRFDSYIMEQREHNQHLDKHNQRLEKILEKLAEK